MPFPSALAPKTVPQQSSETRAGAARWEWPTVGVALLIYGAFALLTWQWHALPVWLAAPAGAVLLAWHSSLQHETIYGHPRRTGDSTWRSAPCRLRSGCPYGPYRETHLGHHKGTHDLADPDIDPESGYRRPGALAGTARVRRLLLRWNTTLAGRLLLGPALVVARC